MPRTKRLQSTGDRGCRVRTIRGQVGQHAVNQVGQWRGNLRTERNQWDGGKHGPGPDSLQQILTLMIKMGSSGQQEIERRPQGINIRPKVDLAGTKLFGCHIIERPHDLPGMGQGLARYVRRFLKPG